MGVLIELLKMILTGIFSSAIVGTAIKAYIDIKENRRFALLKIGLDRAQGIIKAHSDILIAKRATSIAAVYESLVDYCSACNMTTGPRILSLMDESFGPRRPDLEAIRRHRVDMAAKFSGVYLKNKLYFSKELRSIIDKNIIELEALFLRDLGRPAPFPSNEAVAAAENAGALSSEGVQYEIATSSASLSPELSAFVTAILVAASRDEPMAAAEVTSETTAHEQGSGLPELEAFDDSAQDYVDHSFVVDATHIDSATESFKQTEIRRVLNLIEDEFSKTLGMGDDSVISTSSEPADEDETDRTKQNVLSWSISTLVRKCIAFWNG